MVEMYAELFRLMSKVHCRKNSLAPHDSFMVQKPQQSGITRRTFLSRLFKGFLAAIAAALVYPLARFTRFTVKPQPRYIVIRKNIAKGSSYTEHDFILFILDEGPIAISRRCTHLGCRVNYRKEIELIECPCHQSRFTLTGVRVAGPAKDNLSVFPVRTLYDDTGIINGYEVTI